MRIIKKILIVAGTIIGVLLLVVIIYLLYVIISYHRIEDNQVLDINNKSTLALSGDEEYTISSYNIGFGAYCQDYTFFLDGGKESRARSKELMYELIDGATSLVKSYNPDFMLFQEVDLDATRTYHVNQVDYIVQTFEDYSNVFAINFDSSYLMYPIFEPHGKSKSSMLTLSKYKIESTIRRSLPISTSFSKFVDLDRCFMVHRIDLANGKELVLFNTHFSAYGGSDEIRTAQMSMLFKAMKEEFDKGNYCICGGDFNHDFTGDSTKKLNAGLEVDFGWAQPFPGDLINEYAGIHRALNYNDDAINPTCRNCDVPYKVGNFTIIVDGFIVSDNVEVTYLENIVTDFMYSDHNPVIMKFKLK